jgi:hypothetical protein
MLMIALLLICLAFSLWLNLRLMKVAVLYKWKWNREPPDTVHPPSFFCWMGVTHTHTPIVPILLSWMDGRLQREYGTGRQAAPQQ